MSVGSSSSPDASRPPSSMNSSSNLACSESRTGFYGFTSFAVTNILLLLPLSARVLHVGFQRWRRRRAASTSTPPSHVDLFTYHMVAMELYSMMGTVLYCGGIYVGNWLVMVVGFFSFSIVLPGQTLFHCLTCLERYLAVVHPVTYLGLRNSRGARIRNISIGFVWLLCLVWMAVTYVYLPVVPVVLFSCLYTVSLLVSSFASLSVLRALTRPSPGERVGGKEGAGLSKQRVLHIIVAIMGVLLLRFSGLMVCMVMYWCAVGAIGNGCVVLIISFWFCLPSSLVLPLLFLDRAGQQDKGQSRTS